MGGNKEKSQGLGRSLIRHHNQLVQQSKDRGKALRQQRRILESITDVTDIDAVIEQAEEADRVYTVDNPDPNLLVNLDLDGVLSVEERREEQREEEALHAGSLRVPRRPPWNASMSLEEFDANERQEFLVWRRNLAKLEENDKLVLTPFEKNLDIWRQLWRVLERSDLLVMVVDARDPLFYRCPDLEAYAQEIDEQKKTLLLVNKADLLPFTVRFVLGQFLCICMHFCEPDDIDNEFSFAGRNREDMQYGAEAMLQGHMRFGRGSDMEMLQGVTSVSNVPLLTNGAWALLIISKVLKWDS